MTEAAPRWIDRLIAARWPCAILAVVLALACIPPAWNVRFNRSVENMFAPDDPLLGPYETVKSTFGGNEIVLAVYDDPELLAVDGAGIRRLAEIGGRLREIPGVRDVLTLDRPIGESIVDPDNAVSKALRDVFAGYTHSVDGRTAAAVCMLDPQTDGTTREAAIRRIRQVMESLPDSLPAGQIAGEPVLVEEGFRTLEADGQRLAIWSTILLAASLAFSFRSLRWIVLPLAVVQFSLLATRALLVVSGMELTMVSSMLAAILTVVGIATTVHVVVQYRELRFGGLSAESALRGATVLLASPVIWSCVTDAVGFGSLMASQVGPVRDFGLMTAIGSLLVLLGLALCTPLGVLLGAGRERLAPGWGEQGLGALLIVSLAWLQRRPYKAALAIVASAVVGLVGVTRLEVETDFTRNFRAGSPLVRSYEDIETKFGGAGVLDVAIPAPEQLTYEYLARVLELERRLREEVRVTDEQGEETAGLTKVLSAADAIDAAANAGRLPRLTRDFAVRFAWNRMRETIPAFAEALHARRVEGAAPRAPAGAASEPDAQERPDERWLLRIMMRARERQPAQEKQRLIEQVRRVVAEELARDAWQAYRMPETDAGAGELNRGLVTGYFVLLTNLIESVVRDQWTSFGLASLGVGLCLLAALRNVRLALLALVPNALPVILVLGLLGWFGVKMNLGAAMIAAVSMGLTVDGSLHYLVGYRQLRAAGKSRVAALRHVQAGVGRAMLLSTVALMLGFSVLCTSPFVPTVTFGWLMSLAMFGGLLGNLYLLPLLLTLTERSR